MVQDQPKPPATSTTPKTAAPPKRANPSTLSTIPIAVGVRSPLVEGSHEGIVKATARTAPPRKPRAANNRAISILPATGISKNSPPNRTGGNPHQPDDPVPVPTSARREGPRNGRYEGDGSYNPGVMKSPRGVSSLDEAR